MEERKNGEAEISDLVVLLDEENNEHQFIIQEVFEIEGFKYAILEPTEGDEESAVILKFDKDEAANDILITIDDEDEWDFVVNSIGDTLES
jgi:uncharacterized protein YrzB (UPF0473 family)